MGQIGGLGGPGGLDPSIELQRIGAAPQAAPQTGTDDDLLGGGPAFVSTRPRSTGLSASMLQARLGASLDADTGAGDTPSLGSDDTPALSGAGDDPLGGTGLDGGDGIVRDDAGAATLALPGELGRLARKSSGFGTAIDGHKARVADAKEAVTEIKTEIQTANKEMKAGKFDAAATRLESALTKKHQLGQSSSWQVAYRKPPSAELITKKVASKEAAQAFVMTHGGSYKQVGNEGEVRSGLELIGDVRSAQVRTTIKQLKFLSGMKAKGVTPSNPPTKSQLQAYFKKLGKGDAALQAFGKLADAYYVHTATYSKELGLAKVKDVGRPKGWENVSTRRSGALKQGARKGQRIIDCEGYAYIAAQVLGKPNGAGYEVKYVSAVPTGTMSLENPGHQMLLVGNPAKAVITNEKVVKIANPAAAGAKLVTTAKEEGVNSPTIYGGSSLKAAQDAAMNQTASSQIR